MNSRLRAIITIVFIAAFFTTAPLVLLFTSGYRIDWQHSRVRKTGSIHAETIPQDATVIVHGVGSRRGSPATFSRLLPGEYGVRIEREGYLPWEKRLEVSSGTTTFAVGTVLYRDVLPHKTLDRVIRAAEWSPDGSDAAVLAENAGLLELLAINDGRPPVLLGRFALDAYKDAALDWSPDGRAVLLTGTADAAPHALVYSAVAPQQAVAVHEALPSPLRSTATVRWLNADTLTATGEKAAYKVSADTGVATLAHRSGTAYRLLDYTENDRKGYILYEPIAKTERRVWLGETTNENAFVPRTSFETAAAHFGAADAGMLLVADARDGNTFAYDPAKDVTATYGRVMPVRDPDGERMLLCGDFEIVLRHEDGSRELLTRLSTPISGCAWSPERGAVLYATDTGIFAFEIDGRDHHVTTELVRFSAIRGFAVDPVARVLRLEGSVGNQRGLYDREL